MKSNNNLKIVSLFSGCGGLDLGFKKAGFDIIWANEYDKVIWESFEKNFPTITLDKRSISDIPVNEIPDCDGIIGGPPCQSWSEAGAGKGKNDKRGKLFWEYIRILEDKKPKFFLAENVSGILSKRHKESFDQILEDFEKAGYDIYHKLLNANDFGVAEDRDRVIIIGFRKDLKINFLYPIPLNFKPKLIDIILDLKDNALPALEKNYANKLCNLSMINHEYMIGGFSSMYMSRNRVRNWHEPSFTIQAGGRQAPIHPDAPKMIKVKEDKFEFNISEIEKYRRLSVRECLRIQDFPDNFNLYYKNVSDGYKMVGNAVPVGLAYHVADSIHKSLIGSNSDQIKQGKVEHNINIIKSNFKSTNNNLVKL
jgi:DNA (cytosine-5)-methyltransferase 1